MLSFNRYIYFSQDQDDSQIDQYLACGRNYKIIRDAVAKAMLDCNMNGIQKAIEVFIYSFAHTHSETQRVEHSNQSHIYLLMFLV